MARFWQLAGLFVALFLCGLNVVHAQETTTITYDALGRMVGTATSGGPVTGQSKTIAYDPAGNRTSYVVTGAPQSTLSIGAASANEGSPLSFTVTRTGATNAAVSASWATSNGTAAAGTNYTASSGTVSFAAGATTATISVPTNWDSINTPNLTMTVTLSSPSIGAQLLTPIGQGTIVNTDISALSISTAFATEGASLTFTVTRSGEWSRAVSATWTTSDGTAKAGTNYTSSTGTVSFAAGEFVKSVIVQTVSDGVDTPNLTMSVNLSAPSDGAAIATASGTGSIYNSALPSLLVAVTSASEGSPLSISLARAGDRTYPASATWATRDGTAKAGVNYTAANGTVSFAAGEYSKSVSVSTIHDGIFTPDLELYLDFSSPSGLNISSSNTTGTIINTDVSTLSITPASSSEGSPLTFTVTRSGLVTQAVSASWSTSNGTAIAGTNYAASSGTVNFAAGATTATISVPTTADGVHTANLTMAATLSAPSAGAVLGPVSATGTIVDTDVSTVSIAPASSNEGSPLTFTVTRTGFTNTAVSASWSTSNGTAVAGTNYTPSSGTVSFAAGATTAAISVPTIADGIPTASLRMTVFLTAPFTGAKLGGAASATGTIVNTDSPATISIAPASANEGGNLTFVVTRSGNMAQSVNASWATSNGTAKSPTNYVQSSGIVTFSPNQNTAQITVLTASDGFSTPDLAMAVTLSGPSSGTVIGTAVATGTVKNTDTSPTISSAASSANEGQPLVFNVTRAGSTTGTSTVSWYASSGTAIQGINYSAASGTLTFALGETAKTISISTIDDGAATGNFVMYLNFSSPSPGTKLLTSSVAGTIANIDTNPTIGIASASANEGAAITFILTRTGSTAQAATVNWATTNGTALAGVNYTAGSGTAIFAAGASTTTIVVQSINDQIYTGTRSFNVSLSSPSAGYAVFPATAAGYVIDTAPTLSVGSAAGTAGTTMLIPVTRSGDTSSAVTVNYSTSDFPPTTVAGIDFVSTSGTLTIPAGATSANIPVVTLLPGSGYPRGTFRMTISNPSLHAGISSSISNNTINNFN